MSLVIQLENKHTGECFSIKEGENFHGLIYTLYNQDAERLAEFYNLDVATKICIALSEYGSKV